jgi:uncharacterized protein
MGKRVGQPVSRTASMEPVLPEERFRVLLFVSAIAAVYAVSVVLALRLVIQRKWRREAPHSERRMRVFVFGAAVFGVLCAVYAAFVEPYWLEVTHIRVDSERWSGKPLRIVHLSDTHCESKARLEERLPGVVRDEHPDLILFTGDTVNTPQGLPVFKRLLSKLSEIAPTIVVRGNWDVWFWSKLDLFGGTGALEVANSAVSIPVHGKSVWVGGLTVDADHEPRGLLSSAPSEQLRILLHHYPDEVLRAAKLGVDLYLAGHTHGGQVALPFYGALVTLSRLGKQFESGLHRVGNTWEYTNRGLGMEGGTSPRVRFAARPEVTVIDVWHAGDGQGPR